MQIPLEKNRPLEAVSERDIDFLLLEEFSTSKDFASRFLSALLGETARGRLVGVWKSLVDSFGECDLLAAWDLEGGGRFAALIENKIGEDFQPDQPQRYLARAEWGEKQGAWKQWQTVLVSPAAWTSSRPEAALFSKHLSYEQILDWLGCDADGRRKHKQWIIAEAIEQGRRGYAKQVNPVTTSFWHRYWTELRLAHPHVNMKKPGPQGPKGDWPVLGSLPSGVRLVHKMAKGVLDLEFSGIALDELAARVARLKLPDIEAVQTSKSVSARIRVVSIDRYGDFEAQADAIRLAWRAADRLLQTAPLIIGDKSASGQHTALSI